MYKLNYFNFEKRKDKYLITNDLGKFAFLSEDEFRKLIHREEIANEEELKEKCFIYDENMELFANRACYGVRD